VLRAKRRPRSSRLVVAIAVAGALAATSFPAVARAQVTSAPAAAAKEDLTTLEKSLSEQHDALSTSDCATACRALASIRRAADKICALDPGDRCAAGRAKAEDATRRVRDACPECAIASAPTAPAPGKEERAMTKGGTGSKAAESPAATSPDMATAQSGPPSESKRGGCAGCTTTSAAPGDLTGGALAGLALAFALARRRRRSTDA
jgi:MYXO-CTERM domain-containing protein